MIHTFDFTKLSVMESQGLLQSLVCPRPIAFASTVDALGNVNLSPFSFFNMFSTNPPIVVFSPSRRGRDATTKHTYENVLEVPEVVINIVNYAIVEQTSLASVEYEKGVNEFIKAGLTPVPSERVKPPRVAESPASLECRVNEIIPLGTGGGAGTLVVCEVLLVHVKEEVLDASGKRADPRALDLVARMGGDYYAHIANESLFIVPKPNQKKGIGVDQIPFRIRNSRILSGNNLGRLGNTEVMPDKDAVSAFANDPRIAEIFERFSHHTESLEDHLHQLAKELLEAGQVDDAWKTLLQLP
ncbi:flavin reductase family protein [Cytophagaceae bacterium DM2B3-1]|uniref:Flavin reductase family protein n=1 Tax=Xanthocytophaga flava TaxID=3048013 RepID=A0ABT7CUZ7_9BACT|nr:flavin reductase family protein [Xanthocytophaga flavus]MDJ1496449.1 flavin reductase family protein [Xanthocytophaga flavus]